IETIDTVPTYDPYVNISGHHRHSELWLDPRHRAVGVSQEHPDNSTPSGVWHGHVRTHQPAGHPREADVRWDLENNRDLLARVVLGDSSEWDGSNHVGSRTDDARAAWEELCEIIDSNPAHYTYWQLDEWIDQAMRDTITADTSDEQIR